MDLNKVRGLAENLMAKHGLNGWTLRFENKKGRAGVCEHSRHRIGLSAPIMLASDEDGVTQVILHEIAHALVGHGAAHGSVWREKVIEIGGSPSEEYNVDGIGKILLDSKRRRPTRAEWKPERMRELAENIRAMYEKYVVFHSDHREAQAGAMTLFTFHTYVWNLANFAGYVLVTAPTSQAGKSAVFNVARTLVNRPFVVADPTPASLFRAIDMMQPTLMVDEADMLAENKSLRVVLNAGFEPGTPIVRAGHTFSPWCPKMFSGISGIKPPLTDMTLSRCIQIHLRRRAPHESFERFDRFTAAQEAAPMREALSSWGEWAVEALIGAKPALGNIGEDRQEDIWAQLFAIADLFGWGAKAREWARELHQSIPRPADPAVQILHDVFRVLDDWSQPRIPTATLAALRNDLENRDFDEDLSANQLGRRLAAFGINSDQSPFRPTGKRTETPVRGYTFKRSGRLLPQWEDARTRYRLT